MLQDFDTVSNGSSVALGPLANTGCGSGGLGPGPDVTALVLVYTKLDRWVGGGVGLRATDPMSLRVCLSLKLSRHATAFYMIIDI